MSKETVELRRWTSETLGCSVLTSRAPARENRKIEIVVLALGFKSNVAFLELIQ